MSRSGLFGGRQGSDCRVFVQGRRKLGITPHVAAKDKHSALDGRTRRHEGYKTSLKVRLSLEEAFGWMKTVGGLAKTKLIGQAKLAGQALLTNTFQRPANFDPRLNADRAAVGWR